MFYVALLINETNTGSLLMETEGDFFIDIRKRTLIFTFPISTAKFNYAKTSEIVNGLFNNMATLPTSNYIDSGVTSYNHLAKYEDVAIIKPKDFMSDFCAVNGLIVNFKNSGGVEFKKMGAYFDAILSSNPIHIDNIKDVSTKYAQDLSFVSVSVGQDKKDYDVYTYLQDWNKILTFAQTNRNASESLDLSNSKLRTDFSGILDAYLKRSQQSTTNSKDNFIFNPSFIARANVSPTISLYDYFTPKDVLLNWSKYLSFIFQNFGKDSLVLSSNGGTSDDITINGVSQLSGVTINETPRLLPIEYNFTCLIDDIEFSENIISIDHEGETVKLFVIEAETTDNFSEQKIKALKIQN